MNDSSNHSNSDKTLARVLLDGFVSEDKKGLPTQRYLSNKAVAKNPLYDGFEDECRRALARLLRAGELPRDLCHSLASLIAPPDDPDAAGRWLRFNRRKREKTTDHIRATAIVRRLAELRRESKTDREAYEIAANEFNMSEESLKNYWTAAKPFRDLGVI